MRKNEEIAKVFEKLVSIDSPSLKEREMADYLKKLFGEIGVEMEEDNSQNITGSNAGNLFARLDGEIGSTPLLLGVHMDTVEPSRGKKAVFHRQRRRLSHGAGSKPENQGNRPHLRTYPRTGQTGVSLA